MFAMFVQQSRHQSVLVFADGAATREGIGSAAVVLLPLGYDETEVEHSVTFSAPTCSHDMEVESVLLAMQNALKYYNSTAVKKRHEAISSFYQTVNQRSILSLTILSHTLFIRLLTQSGLYCASCKIYVGHGLTYMDSGSHGN